MGGKLATEGRVPGGGTTGAEMGGLRRTTAVGVLEELVVGDRHRFVDRVGLSHYLWRINNADSPSCCSLYDTQLYCLGIGLFSSCTLALRLRRRPHCLLRALSFNHRGILLSIVAHIVLRYHALRSLQALINLLADYLGRRPFGDHFLTLLIQLHPY